MFIFSQATKALRIFQNFCSYIQGVAQKFPGCGYMEIDKYNTNQKQLLKNKKNAAF